jgi:hypothetical protein
LAGFAGTDGEEDAPSLTGTVATLPDLVTVTTPPGLPLDEQALSTSATAPISSAAMPVDRDTWAFCTPPR